MVEPDFVLKWHKKGAPESVLQGGGHWIWRGSSSAGMAVERTEAAVRPRRVRIVVLDLFLFHF